MPLLSRDPTVGLRRRADRQLPWIVSSPVSAAVETATSALHRLGRRMERRQRQELEASGDLELADVRQVIEEMRQATRHLGDDGTITHTLPSGADFEDSPAARRLGLDEFDLQMLWLGDIDWLRRRHGVVWPRRLAWSLQTADTCRLRWQHRLRLTVGLRSTSLVWHVMHTSSDEQLHWQCPDCDTEGRCHDRDPDHLCIGEIVLDVAAVDRGELHKRGYSPHVFCSFCGLDAPHDRDRTAAPASR